MAIRNKCVLAALGGLATAACGGAAVGQVVTHDLFYTRYGVNMPATDFNVKKCVVAYDRTTQLATLSGLTNIAQTLGADGITFAPDGDLLVGGQSTSRMFKVNRTTGAQTNQLVGQTSSYHVKLDPSGLKAWTAGIPDRLAEVPLNPFAPGTSHVITGDDLLITDLEWAAGKVFYTSSSVVGHGNFGEINMTTFVTTRRIANVDYAHGMQFDPFTNNLLLFGEHQIAQINPATNPPTVVSVLDLTARYPNLDLDQGAVDGTGLIYGASNDGNLVVLDYSGTHVVGTSGATADMKYLEQYLDDIAPILGPGANPCCPIGSGAFDFRDAQQSQIPGVSTVPFDFRVADDFYLLPGRIYNIHSIEGTMITDSLLPKAQLEIYNDCNGLPADPPIRTALQATSIIDTGATFQGKHVLTIRFDFTDLWLRGGENYWASFIGKGLGSADEVWFWGTAGSGVRSEIKGRPGAFKSVIANQPTWRAIDGVNCPTCIGCTDFAFCVSAESCKILNDNGTYLPSGTISLDGGTGPIFARTADDFVVPPCVNRQLCYVEAYIASNCDAARVSIYPGTCVNANPLEGIAGGIFPNGYTPSYTLTPDRIINTGQFATINNIAYPILCLQFWNFGTINLAPGDYWISAYGVSQGNVIQRAYFLFNQDCDRPCLIKWSEGVVYGPAAGQQAPYHWVRGSTVFGTPHDYAFLIATHDPSTPQTGGFGNSVCAADFDGSGTVTTQDVFAYLAAWFAGCP